MLLDGHSPSVVRVDKLAAVTLILAFLLAPLVILTLCFAIEVFAGLSPLAPVQRVIDVSPRTIIVIPAHDEQAVLPRTLEQLKAAASEHSRILLVADNCADGTAEIGRRLGVEVIERSDAKRRGKGFALDYARSHLKADPPDVVIIVDADCLIDDRSIAALAGACFLTGHPCQATNLQEPSADSTPPVQLSTFAFFIKNVIRQRGLQRLAGRVHLLGTGMAFPWQIFLQSDLATSNITEDLKLGQDLAQAGHTPIFVEEAIVSSNAETERNTLSQRRRWEGGFLKNALVAGPAMFARSLGRRDSQMLWAAIDTMIPPFALLVVLDFAGLFTAAGLSWIGSVHYWPLFCSFGALALALIALVFAWGCGGSRFIGLGTLAQAPLYVLWKIPMYLGLARRGAPKEWVRTGR
jgi:cellulose synthase/poly-beta-1,6-N-acetylglucosamine synthase-like glycosyltransferase